MASSVGGGIRGLIKKYGKVAVGVHFSVSGASAAALYFAIRNNVSVESILNKFPTMGTGNPSSCDEDKKEDRTRNRIAEAANSAGGALALALLCNKALLPIRVPITMVLTPPVARFLARRKNIFKTGT